MPLSDKLEKSLKATATIAVAELFSEGKSAANDPERWPLAQISEILDTRVCPLCASVAGLILRVGSREYAEWRSPSHINCRRVLVYISAAENREATFKAPDRKLIEKHGHYHVDPTKHAELRIPAEPAGRNIIVRRVRNLESGKIETRIDWAPWFEQVPAWKRELILQARVTPDGEAFNALLARLGLTDPTSPAQARQGVLLGLKDRLEGWITAHSSGGPPSGAAPGGGTPTPASTALHRAVWERIAAGVTTEADVRDVGALVRTATAEASAADYPGAVRDALAEIRTLGNPGTQPWAKGSRQAVKEAVEAAAEYLPAEWLARSNETPLLAKQVERGFYRPAVNGNPAELALSGATRDDLREVALHELGHRFEDVVPRILALEKEFYERRTAGEGLRWLGPGHKPSERTRVDRFISPYMGKDYKGKWFELLTMGLEGLFAGSFDIRQDEDYLDFILGLLAAL